MIAYTPKLILGRSLVDFANYVVLDRLHKGIDHTDIKSFCKNYAPDVYEPECSDSPYLALLRSPRNFEPAEISEGVVRLAMKALTSVYEDGWADLLLGIYALDELLELSHKGYLEFSVVRGSMWFNSTAKFERKFDALVRVEIARAARS